MTQSFRWSPLLLAAVLSPAMLQQVDCTPSGNANLASLEVEAAGLNRVVGFSGSTLKYDVWTTAGVDTIVVRAQTAAPTARVNYRQTIDGTITSGLLGTGGGEVSLSIPLVGASSLQLDVSDGSMRKLYILDINPACSGNDCDDANSCTTDSCDVSTKICDFVVSPDGTACDYAAAGDGLCVNGLCETSCGNGTVDAGEFCDDGPQNGAGQGFCLADCSAAQDCGDEVTNGTESCDDGALNGTGEGSCLSDCTGVQVCGDATVNGTELCETGDSVDCTTLGGDFIEGSAVCDVDCAAWDTSACVQSALPDVLMCGNGCYRYDSAVQGAVVAPFIEELTYFDGATEQSWGPYHPTFGPDGLLWSMYTPYFASDNFTDISVYDVFANELVSCHTLGTNNSRACEITGNTSNFWAFGNWKLGNITGTHLSILGAGNIGGYQAPHYIIVGVDANANWTGIVQDPALSVREITTAPPNPATWDQEEVVYGVTSDVTTGEDWITRFTIIDGQPGGRQDVVPLNAAAGGTLYSGLTSQIKRLRVSPDGLTVYAYVRDNAFICQPGATPIQSCIDDQGIWRMDTSTGFSEKIIDLYPFAPLTNAVGDFAVNPIDGDLYVTMTTPAAAHQGELLRYSADMVAADPPSSTVFLYQTATHTSIEFFPEICEESPTEDPDCSPATCGDGYLNLSAGEICDGGGETAACDVDCTLTSCGDNVVNATAGEWCDDGNTTGGDGCAADCTSEATQVIAYVAKQDSATQAELYSAYSDGFSNQKLNGTLVSGGLVFNLRWSPDGSMLAFTADAEVDNQVELYIVDADGSNLRKANGPLASGGAVLGTEFEWSPDSQRIAYLARQNDATVVELFTSAADGTDNQRVNGAFVAGGRISGANAWAWSPSGARLAYVADQDADNVTELYTSAPDGTDNQKVSGAMVSGGDINNGPFRFVWSPDSAFLAYVADQETDNVFEVFVATPDGSVRNKVNDPFVSGGDAAGGNGIPTVLWNPNGSRLAYRADATTDGVFEVFTNVPDGSDHRTVTGALQGSGATYFAWSPDGAQVAYVATQDSPTKPELYTSAPNGSGNRRVSLATTDGVQAANALAAPFVWAPDSQRIVYRAGVFGSAGQFELVNASISIPNGGPVNGPLVAGGSVDIFTWSPDGTRIAYLADQDVVGELALYTSEPLGGDNQRVSAPSLSGSGVTTQVGFYETVRWSPDSSRIAYINDQGVAGRDELYTASPDGSINQKASGATMAGEMSPYIEWRPMTIGFVSCEISGASCPSGTSCYPTSTGDFCLPTGTQTEGSPCGLVNDCGAGLGCLSLPSDPSSDYCTPLCSGAIACASGGPCSGLGGDSNLRACLLEPCDLFAPACTAGAACYPANLDDGGTSVQGNFCWAAGSGGEGTVCTGFPDCASGLTCIFDGVDNLCFVMCDLGAPVCTGTGDTCVPVSAEYGACVTP